MSRTNRDIRDQFDFFNELVLEPKTVTERIIYLSNKKNNVHRSSGESGVLHSNTSDDLTLAVEKNKRDRKYALKLKCPSLTTEPLFRFDSDGPAHRNNDPAVPLEEQVITTPHFTSFDNDGRPKAYKNAALLKTDQEPLIRGDINFGTSLFCIETNCKHESGHFPEVNNEIPEFDFQQYDDNNLDSVNFE